MENIHPQPSRMHDFAAWISLGVASIFHLVLLIGFGLFEHPGTALNEHTYAFTLSIGLFEVWLGILIWNLFASYKIYEHLPSEDHALAYRQLINKEYSEVGLFHIVVMLALSQEHWLLVWLFAILYSQRTFQMMRAVSGHQGLRQEGRWIKAPVGTMAGTGQVITLVTFLTYILSLDQDPHQLFFIILSYGLWSALIAGQAWQYAKYGNGWVMVPLLVYLTGLLVTRGLTGNYQGFELIGVLVIWLLALGLFARVRYLQVQQNNN